MANPHLPIQDSPEGIDISTPPSSERSRSERNRLTPSSEAVALMPQHSGFSHRGLAICSPGGWAECGCILMGSETRVFNKMNVNHDQRVVIGHQQLVQNNKVLIQTHDPAYAETIEQTAEAPHRLAVSRRKLGPISSIKPLLIV